MPIPPLCQLSRRAGKAGAKFRLSGQGDAALTSPLPPQTLLTMSTSKTRRRSDPSLMELWSVCGHSPLSPLPVPTLAEVLHSSTGHCHPHSHVLLQQPPTCLGTPHSPACSVLSPLSCDTAARRGDVIGPGL